MDSLDALLSTPRTSKLDPSEAPIRFERLVRWNTPEVAELIGEEQIKLRALLRG